MKAFTVLFLLSGVVSGSLEPQANNWDQLIEDADKALEKDGPLCPICFLELKSKPDNVVVPCAGQHEYHFDCIHPWFEREQRDRNERNHNHTEFEEFHLIEQPYVKCPMCKESIDENDWPTNPDGHNFRYRGNLDDQIHSLTTSGLTDIQNNSDNNDNPRDIDENRIARNDVENNQDDLDVNNSNQLNSNDRVLDQEELELIREELQYTQEQLQATQRQLHVTQDQLHVNQDQLHVTQEQLEEAQLLREQIRSLQSRIENERESRSQEWERIHNELQSEERRLNEELSRFEQMQSNVDESRALSASKDKLIWKLYVYFIVFTVIFVIIFIVMCVYIHLHKKAVKTGNPGKTHEKHAPVIV